MHVCGHDVGVFRAHFAEIKGEDLRRTPASIARWNEVAAQCRAIAAATMPNNGKHIKLDHSFDLEPSAAASLQPTGPDGRPRPSPIHPQAQCPFLGKEA
jgi:hypothetical protein